MCLLFYFYRDPKRTIVAEKGDILSPADGEIVAIEKVNEINGTKGKFIKISIFLNAFNVHIQRMPISGVISNIDVLPGSLLPAFMAEAGKKNKQNIYTIKGDITAVVKQIAGVLVHRPVSWVDVGEKLDIGEQFGMITFGSRVELYVPATCTVESKIGDKVFAGISNLGKIQKTLNKKNTVSGKKNK
jgi:phosphatidylserine decarboxylase